MDSHNSRMVDIACAEHTSQYFLITPKLLPKRSPFRVVDEIDQGNPRNERMVHSRMVVHTRLIRLRTVDIACVEHTSQYFLITSRSLPNRSPPPVSLTISTKERTLAPNAWFTQAWSASLVRNISRSISSSCPSCGAPTVSLTRLTKE